MKYSHSMDYFKKGYRQYRLAVRKAVKSGSARDKKYIIGSLDEYISQYLSVKNEGIKNVKAQLEYEIKHVTHRQNAVAMRKAQKELYDTYSGIVNAKLNKLESTWKGTESDLLAAKQNIINEGKKEMEKLKPGMLVAYQNMKTTDFAEMYRDEIKKMYYERRNAGDTSSEAKHFISQYWFGSK